MCSLITSGKLKTALGNLQEDSGVYRRLWELMGVKENPQWILFSESGEKLKQIIFLPFYVLLMHARPQSQVRPACVGPGLWG